MSMGTRHTSPIAWTFARKANGNILTYLAKAFHTSPKARRPPDEYFAYETRVL